MAVLLPEMREILKKDEKKNEYSAYRAEKRRRMLKRIT